MLRSAISATVSLGSLIYHTTDNIFVCRSGKQYDLMTHKLHFVLVSYLSYLMMHSIETIECIRDNLCTLGALPLDAIWKYKMS